jgi:hypothetical protein
MEVGTFMTWVGVIILMTMIWIVHSTFDAYARVATGASRSLIWGDCKVQFRRKTDWTVRPLGNTSPSLALRLPQSEA